MLQLRIGFPSGHYFGASADNPREPEWPPHPSRVYSALVAAAYSGGNPPSPDERHALHRLEAAPPPALDFPAADLRPAPDVFVPVNDVHTRIEAHKPKLLSLGVLMPNRQPRQFPSAFLLGEPEIRLQWPVEIEDRELAALDGIAQRVTHVGTSHSFATAQFLRAEPFHPRWEPRADGGHFLRVPQAGRLDELDRLFADRVSMLRRPAPLCEVALPYAPAGAPGAVFVPTRHDWVALRVADAAWGADTAHTMARALRKAVMSVLGDDAPAAVHGHDPQIEHVAWLPLPDVGHGFARGRIRGIAVGLPLAMPADQRVMTLAALARLRDVVLPDGQVARVSASIEGPQTPAVMRRSTWVTACRTWATVTPVLLDRPPRKASPEASAAALADSLVMAGFPRPIDIRLSSQSLFTGAPSTRDVPTQVPRVHARVTFAEPVEGPVIAGRWRNFGVGVFRPLPDGGLS